MRFCINLIIIILLFSGCKKKDETIYIRGKIYDANQKTFVKGARVILQASVIKSGVYSASFSDIASGISSADGSFSFDIKVEHVVEYKFIVNKDKYFYSETNIKADNWSGGNTYNPVVNVYPEAYVRLNIQNANPFNEYDVVYYAFASNYYDCSGCCSGNYITGTGMSYNASMICKTQGGRNSDITWHFNKNNKDIRHDTSVYCKPFDTTFVKIQY